MTSDCPGTDREEALAPPESHAIIELTAVVIITEVLLTAWTCTKSVVSMVAELWSMADAIDAGLGSAPIKPVPGVN